MRAPRSRARRISASVSAACTSICSTTVVPTRAARPRFAACARRFAPEPTAIRFWPSRSVQMAAHPVAASTLATRRSSTPACLSPASAPSASASAPTAPAMTTCAASSAAATAWLAPLPPGWMETPGPSNVSPGCGRRSSAKIRSRLIDPKTTIIGLASVSTCLRCPMALARAGRPCLAGDMHDSEMAAVVGEREGETLEAAIGQRPWFHQIDFGNGVLTPGTSRPRRYAGCAACCSTGSSFGAGPFWTSAAGTEPTASGVAPRRGCDGHGPLCVERSAAQPGGVRSSGGPARADGAGHRHAGRGTQHRASGAARHRPVPRRAVPPTRSARRARAGCGARGRNPDRRDADGHAVAPPAGDAVPPGSTLEHDPTNWWTPNRPCVEAMLRDLGFKTIRFTQPDWRWRRGMFHASR